jgi:hypothetical protein
VPFLRVLRDKRGYETTYLVHWFRDGNKQRSKILYMFRTPPGVRVGRDVLDPAVVREIEAEHPEIEFDWRALLEHRQVIDQATEPRRSRPKKKPEPPAESPAVPPSPPLPAVPEAIEGDTREQQLAFLARWYPELRDRIPHRTQDPARQVVLTALVERLNAAAWETEADIAAGLQGAAEALHRLSRVFSKRRRRNRRTRAVAVGNAAGAVPQANPEQTDGTTPDAEPHTDDESSEDAPA